MSHSPTDRPYVQTWLKRVERQLRGSGSISQLSYALALKLGGDHDEWNRRLRDILTGEQAPTAELIADIDQLLAKPVDGDTGPSDQQGRLL